MKRLQDSLLDITAIVLANLCVGYIMTSQNEEAEELMRRIEKEGTIHTHTYILTYIQFKNQIQLFVLRNIPYQYVYAYLYVGTYVHVCIPYIHTYILPFVLSNTIPICIHHYNNDITVYICMYVLL